MTANAQRGEVALTVDDRTYLLRLSINAICALETKAERPFAAVLIGIQGRRVSDARLLIWGALQPKHAEEFPTFDAVGDLFDRMGGGINAIRDLVTKLLDANQPPKTDGGEPADPPIAQVGTGPGSTAKPDASA